MAAERIALQGFVPVEHRARQFDFREELQPVVDRLSAKLPPHQVWEYYSTSPNDNKGVVTFPYCRVDGALMDTQTWTSMARKAKDPVEAEECYRNAARWAFIPLVWVEVGFGGLVNLAVNPASRNWSAGVGRVTNDAERAKGIMEGGKKFYHDVLADFARLRIERGITEDIFTEHKLEHLLEPFGPRES